MAKQIIVLALIFFAAVGMASAATSPSAAPTAAPTATPTVSHTTPTPAGAPVAFDDDVIGTISGSITDAAPVGGPVPDGAFPDLVPEPAPPSGAAALSVAGAVTAAGFVGSLFL